MTTTVIQTVTTSTIHPGASKVLHAFPPGSTIALCGRVRAAQPQRVAGGKRCATCLEVAGGKQLFCR